MRLHSVLCSLALCMVPSVAHAASGSDVVASIERSAHRALARLRAHDGTVLAPFTTDGCSGSLSSVWTVVADRFPAFAEAHGENPPWEVCCESHDRKYHAAGPDPDPNSSLAARLAADDALKSCVIKTGESRRTEIAALYSVDEKSVSEAYRAISEAMHLAVRFGGAPCSGFPWRWGYGYPDCFVMPRDLSN